jgi:tetratricopeptide (TPR) repeat protein
MHAIFVTLAALQAAPATAPDSVPLYDDLGDHHYEITTSEPPAQEYFDQGLRLYYAFNHQEAIRSFRAAQALDPECAMCWWGEALAWGPNINLPMDSASGVAAHAAARRALEALGASEGASERERALVEAVARRYAPEPLADRAALDSAYARAMEDVSRRWPDDPEAAVLYAEAEMTLRPWDYWTEEEEPHAGIRAALAKLEGVMDRNPDHPGACHFYIHAVEKVDPDRAVPCAERLADLMPGAGHLVHMPGHIYIRVGRYLDAIRANEHAVHADETYIRDQRPGMGVYTAGYYPHNYDFMAFAATMAGRSGQAVEAARKMSEVVPEEMHRAPGMTFVQHFLTRPLQVYVRFGLWEEILRTAEPAEDLHHARGMWHYARGRALAATGDLDGAEADLARLRELAEGPELAGVTLEFNESQHVLRIGAAVLAGRLAEARGDMDGAVEELHEAVRLEDALLYGEPPEWTVPVRHELGEVLLAAGRAEEAERIYREDLERFRENGWSLIGLARALEARGRTDEADETRSRFRAAWREADVEIAASSF